jgi:hypothetical protein
VDWRSVVGEGCCFGRAATGHLVLTELGIPSKLVFGGLLFRAGPDPLRDLLCFCGPNGQGCVIAGKIFAHQWIQSGRNIVDFSVGDWREDAERPANEVEAHQSGIKDFAIQWTAPELPDFVWTDREHLTQGGHPAVGQARYTGFTRNPPDVTSKLESVLFKQVQPQLGQAYEHYKLKERLSAARQGIAIYC